MREQISNRREEKSSIWRLRRTRDYRAHTETYASLWGWQKLWAGSAGRWSACRCNSQNPPGWDRRRGVFRRPWSSLATSETLRGKKQMGKSSACKETGQNQPREVIRLSQSNRLSQHQQCRRAFFFFFFFFLFSLGVIQCCVQMEVKENFISFQFEWDEECPLMLYVRAFTEKPERNPGDSTRLEHPTHRSHMHADTTLCARGTTYSNMLQLITIQPDDSRTVNNLGVCHHYSPQRQPVHLNGGFNLGSRVQTRAQQIVKIWLDVSDQLNIRFADI